MCKHVHGKQAKAIVLAVAWCFVGAALCFADNAHMGAWKLNAAKSQLGPGAPKNSTVVYEAAGDNVKVTVDGTDRDGKPTHNVWMGKFDGKDYPVIGDPNSDERSYTRRGDNAGVIPKFHACCSIIVNEIEQAEAGSLRTRTDTRC